MLIECNWQSKTVPCEQLFQKVKTTYGFCCAFNYYGMNDVSNLVASKPKNTSYIVGGAGPALGLRVVLDLDREQYTSAIRPIYGLSVVVQSSIEFPEMSLQSHTIEVSEELTLSVTPKVFQSTESIRGMNINKRKCLFDNEGQLEWSDKYSYKTCISECKARAIFHYCDCWPYYYPRIRPRKICSLLDIPCLRKHKYNYSTLNKIGDDKELSYADNCSCHPQCNEVIYSLHSDRAKASEMVDFVKTNQSVLNVFYDTVGCHKTEKDVYNTWDRALSSVGGIIGLCIGGSIITIVEIIYFFCQSIMCTFQKKEKRNEVHNYNRQIYIHNVKPYFHKEPVTIFRH
ncbi:hypothetical protein FQA39_LY06439 [Lamprigera yunnana]|nr:hypothetical protein FQA39_LY06439 [Lamprigera yunnana]